MEHLGAISEGQWSSLSGMFTPEEVRFMAQVLNNLPSAFWPCHDSSMNMAGLGEFSYYYSDMANSISSNFGGGILSQKGYYMSDSHPLLASKNSSMSIDICMADMKNSSSFLIEGDDCLNQEMTDKESKLRRGSEISMPDSISEDKCNNPSGNSQKRARSLEDKRREKINDRLRVLQNLVPNGTKVDISTMLEEAVQYVKFLQHQIKLLSSDELWMYAPVAYNGLDIGLDLKNTSLRKS
ncbi:hypothetical protein SO802_028856 [Lithocarpus litseifolius]|uniref:BHLH domain-containing protein n=1 Tax=Lithocarpus litseifolius TaxID=425828 RepID=A0AAW2BRY9_9ROSI